MKRWGLVAVLLGITSVCWGLLSSGTNPFKTGGTEEGWQVAVTDSIASTDPVLLVMGTAAKNNFHQVYSSSKIKATTTAAETLLVYVAGIDSATGKYAREQLVVKTGLADTTTKTYKAIDAAWLEYEGTAIVDVRPTNLAALSLTSISVGNIHNSPALRLFGEADRPAISSFSAGSSTATLNWRVELRVYDTIEDALDMTDGYYVADVISGIGEGSPAPHVFNPPLYISPSSVVALYGAGSAGTGLRLHARIAGLRR